MKNKNETDSIDISIAQNFINEPKKDESKVLVLKNVYFDSQGHVWGEQSSCLEDSYIYKYKDDNFYGKLDIEQKQNAISIDAPIIVCGTPFFDLYNFWVVFMSRILFVYEQNYNYLHIALPDYLPDKKTIIEILKKIGFNNFSFLKKGKLYKSSLVYLPTTIAYKNASNNSSAVKVLSDVIKSKIENDIYMGSKIYIKNNKSNLTEKSRETIEKVLKQMGYSIIECETYSLIDQIKIFKKANIIICPSDEYLTNMLWMDEKSLVVELMMNNDEDNLYFFNLSKSLGHFYSRILCKKEKEIEMSINPLPLNKSYQNMFSIDDENYLKKYIENVETLFFKKKNE